VCSFSNITSHGSRLLLFVKHLAMRNKEVPTKATIHRLVTAFRDTGSVCDRKERRDYWFQSPWCVVVSVLATGPKGRGFEPGQGDGFLRAKTIRSTPSFRMGNKAGRSHVVEFYSM
jgi:hypothetical protein